MSNYGKVYPMVGTTQRRTGPEKAGTIIGTGTGEPRNALVEKVMMQRVDALLGDMFGGDDEEQA